MARKLRPLLSDREFPRMADDLAILNTRDLPVAMAYLNSQLHARSPYKITKADVEMLRHLGGVGRDLIVEDDVLALADKLKAFLSR
jgi:hypothetical protein